MATDAPCPDTQTSRPNWLVVLTIVAMYVALAMLVLLVRRWATNCTPGWIYFGLFAGGSGVSKAALLIWNPGLLWRRQRIGSGTKSWDKIWLVVFLANLFILFFVAVREFDARVGDLGSPGVAWLIGLAINVSGLALFTSSSIANPFFEVSVRIQADQSHRVIDSGPYAIVRHPGYVGLIAALLATPLLLASSWMCLPSLTAALLLVVRTALEDRTLQAELPGYAEYANEVRFRLMPGVW